MVESTNTSSKKEAKKAEYAAKKWIFGDDEIFTTTCLEAGMEPFLVRKITKELIKLQQNKSAPKNRHIKPLALKPDYKNLFHNKTLKLF